MYDCLLIFNREKSKTTQRGEREDHGEPLSYSQLSGGELVDSKHFEDWISHMGKLIFSHVLAYLLFWDNCYIQRKRPKWISSILSPTGRTIMHRGSLTPCQNGIVDHTARSSGAWWRCGLESQHLFFWFVLNFFLKAVYVSVSILFLNPQYGAYSKAFDMYTDLLNNRLTGETFFFFVPLSTDVSLP